MVLSIMENSETISRMDEESSFTQTVITMRENFEREKLRVGENIYRSLGLNMKENGLMIFSMDKVLKQWRTDQFTKECLKMV